MEKLSFFLFLLIVGNFLLVVTCYPNGQVTPSCINMIPDHGVSAQTTLAPYNITASKNTYSPGEKITVTLQGSDPFEGFLLQARRAGGTAAVGTFTVTDTANSQGLDCNGPSSSLVLISSAGCGTNKTCFSNPAGCNAATNADCYFMSSASPQGGSDGIQFEISGKSNGYISIGFSDDTEMENVYNIATSFNNGIIKCSFITRNAISTQQRAANTSYYIFMANGQTNGGAIQYHPLRPFITEDKVNLLGSQIASGNANRPAIIKTHGALMLIAWMTTGSIGMISARYFKQVSKGKQILGKDIWFQAHVFLMLLTVAATITAFVLAFVSVRGWSGGAHPVIGCIVMGLALIQPLIAVFRCAPDSKRRIVFNLVHAINALVIKVLAVTSIFLGLQLLDNSPNQWLPKVMGGFVGWEFLIYLVLDFNLFLKKEDST
ncbi:Ferric-chelate reductase 1 [Acipenser ruthenus]|uniref:Ferric-chelate reductase 1 n=1 Tax=Acipenser ruthenus TaxID=7906 RepID=A0A444UKL3_ACIRT|nr:Ferric-chelate reductase 1 [Acipenser ruthenus]